MSKKCFIMRFILFCIIPKTLFSRLFGFIARVKSPRVFSAIVRYIFCSLYTIDLSQCKIKSSREFDCLSSLFNRELEDYALKPDSGLISPASGVLRSAGKIHSSTYNVKGINYQLNTLLSNEELFARFQEGSYLNVYLSPRDYHNVHSPFSGSIKSIKYISGKLFPVSDFLLATKKDIYALNERVLVELQSENEQYLIVMVAAFNVGDIKVLKQIGENINAGEMLGQFCLGSSVLIFSQNRCYEHLSQGQSVVVNRALI